MKKLKKKLLIMLSALSIGCMIPSFASMAQGWSMEGNEKIYLDDNGQKITGWLDCEGQRYYFWPTNGYMTTGWVPDNGNWYYLKDDGTMARNETLRYYTFDANGVYTPAIPIAQDPGDRGHNYYKGLSAEQAAEADLHAKLLASLALNDPQCHSQFEQVSVASKLVNEYLYRGPVDVLPESNYYYRSPYGVFVAGDWTCAGCTRALGRVLDFMGFDWTHANENDYFHQWVIINMDGYAGYADAQGGYVGYGEYHPIVI